MRVKKYPVQAACDRCSLAFQKKFSRHRFCAKCGPDAELERSRERMRERRAADPDAMRAKQSQWIAENRDRVRRVNKERVRRLGVIPIDQPLHCVECGILTQRLGSGHKFCDTCGPIIKLRANRIRAAAWPKINRERRNAYLRARFAAKPVVRLNSRMSTGIGESLRSGKGIKSWTDLVPYSLQDLQQHLERQFLSGMTWDNMRDWHIDHIVPLKSFKFETADDPEFKAAWSMTNLRPLWSLDNIRKHATRLHLL